MTTLVPPEALGLQLLLRNGITRSGWLTILGADLTSFEEGFPAVRWAWDLWPWPDVFQAQLVAVALDGAWQSPSGHRVPAHLAPPLPTAAPHPDEVTEPLVGRPRVEHRAYRVQLVREGLGRDLAELRPLGPAAAQWRWARGGRALAGDLAWTDRLVLARL